MDRQDNRKINVCDDHRFAINEDEIIIPPDVECVSWDSTFVSFDDNEITFDNFCGNFSQTI